MAASPSSAASSTLLSPSSTSSGDGDEFQSDPAQDGEDDVWSPSLRQDIFMGHSSASEPRHHQYHHLPPLRQHPLSPTYYPNRQANLESVAASHPPIHLPSVNPLLNQLRPPSNPNSLDWSTITRAIHSTNTTTSTNRATSGLTSPWYSQEYPGETSTPYRLPSETSSRSPSPTTHSNLNNLFVDLTESSPTMPVRKAAPSQKRSTRPRPSSSHDNQNCSTSLSNPAKRRRVGAFPTETDIDTQEIDEVDLRDVDDDHGLSRVLEQQRKATVKAQQEQADRPVKFSTLQCIICMESMTNITATHCGHLFCHTCLMEALIAGENQGSEPGKGTSKCPVCRKKVKRPKDGKDTTHCIPLEVKFSTKARPESSLGMGKGKGKVRGGE